MMPFPSTSKVHDSTDRVIGVGGFSASVAELVDAVEAERPPLHDCGQKATGGSSPVNHDAGSSPAARITFKHHPKEGSSKRPVLSLCRPVGHSNQDVKTGGRMSRIMTLAQGKPCVNTSTSNPAKRHGSRWARGFFLTLLITSMRRLSTACGFFFLILSIGLASLTAG